MIHRDNAVVAADPSDALVGGILGRELRRQLTGSAYGQLQRGLIQRNALYGDLTHLAHRFGAGGGIAAVNAADIAADAVGERACDLRIVLQKLQVFALVAHKAAFGQYRRVLGGACDVVEAILGTAVCAVHSAVQGAVHIAAELLAEIIEVVGLGAVRRGIGSGIAVDAQEDLRLEGGSLCHTGLQNHLGAAAGIDEQYRRPLITQDGRQLGGDLPVYIVLVLIGVEAQGAYIGAAVAGINDDPRAGNAAGRVIKLQRKGVAVIAGGIAAHSVGLAEPQRQRITVPCGRGENRVFGEAADAAAGGFEVIEGEGDAAIGIADRITGGLAHIERHSGGCGIGGDAHAVYHNVLHLLAGSGNIPGVDAQAAGQLIIAVGGAAAGKDDHIAHGVVQRTLGQRIVAAVAQIIQRAGGEGFSLGGCYHNGTAAAYLGDLIYLDGGAGFGLVFSLPAALKGDAAEIFDAAGGGGSAVGPGVLHVEGLAVRFGAVALTVVSGQSDGLPIDNGGDLGVLVGHGRQRNIGVPVNGEGAGRHNALEDLHVAGDLIDQRFILMYDGKGI